MLFYLYLAFLVFTESCFLGDSKEKRLCEDWQNEAIEEMLGTCRARGRIPNGFEKLTINKTSASIAAFYSCRKHYKLKGKKLVIKCM